MYNVLVISLSIHGLVSFQLNVTNLLSLNGAPDAFVVQSIRPGSMTFPIRSVMKSIWYIFAGIQLCLEVFYITQHGSNQREKNWRHKSMFISHIGLLVSSRVFFSMKPIAVAKQPQLLHPVKDIDKQSLSLKCRGGSHNHHRTWAQGHKGFDLDFRPQEWKLCIVLTA